MEFPAKITQAFTQAQDWITEQVWFQELKQKWDEQDTQTKIYTQYGLLGGGALLILVVFFTSIWTVHSIKSEIAEKQDLLNQIQSSTEELRRLRDANQGRSGGADGGPWGTYFETIAAQVGAEKANVSTTKETAGKKSELAQESLLDLEVKKINVRQLVKIAFQIENGTRPAKVRMITVDTKPDASGYLDAKLAVSGFTLK